MSEENGYVIRPWLIRDQGQVKMLIAEFLRNQLKFGGDVLPTANNVNWFWDFGFQCSRAGEPTYVAVIGNRVVGYLLAGPYLTNLELTHKTLQVYGMYILPSHQGRFLGILMIRRVRDEIAKLGYTRGITPVLAMNRRVLEIGFTGDSWPWQYSIQWFTGLAEFDSGKGKKSKVED